MTDYVVYVDNNTWKLYHIDQLRQKGGEKCWE